MSLCVLSNNEHQQELHRQAYQEFHTHKQASVLKIVDALLAIEVYFINEETAAGKGGGSQVVAKYPKQFRFKVLSLEGEMQSLRAICRDLWDTQRASQVCF